MAIYHCSVKAISRSAGRSATAAAAYRSGTKIEDMRQGLIHDYTRKKGVLVTGIEAPLGTPEWARERASLWNQAEAAEKRKNSTVAREVEVALPTELQAGQLRYLVQEYSQWLVERYGVAVDWAIHAPHRHGDERNYHAHILMTTRILGPEGFAAKCRVLDAKETGSAEVRVMREQWAALVNRSLEQAGIEARVDHRRLDEQGIVRDPQIHAGPAVTAVERKAAAPEPTPMGVVAAIAQTGGTTTVGQRLAAIVDLNTLREERERQRRLVQERKAAAKRELAASHREPMPDRVVIAQAVAALMAHEAARERENIRRRWEERSRQRALQREQRRVEAEAERREALLERAQLRHGYRRDAWEIRERWSWRQQEREQRRQRQAQDLATERETRAGIRYPDKPHWQRERERQLTEIYGAELAEKLGRWVRVYRHSEDGFLHLSNARVDLVDRGDRVVARKGGTEEEVAALVEIARAKGWERVHLTGSAEFQQRAALAFVAAGLALDDPALEQKARQALEEERRREERERILPQERQRAPESAPIPTPKAAPPPQPTAEEQVAAFWAEIDTEAERIRQEAAAQLPEVQARYTALEKAFYETYQWPKTPPKRGFWGLGGLDPSWKNPEEERGRLKKEMQTLELSRLRELANSRDKAQREAQQRVKERDPERYQRLLDLHYALQRQKTQQAIERSRERRREKGKYRGHGRGD